MPFLSSACLNPQHVDFVGLITALLTLHLTEPQSMQRMDPHISTMLSCLEDAFAHFESAKKGRLDRCEVEDALLEESSKAATKDGKHAATRTGHRLASKLFESIRECVGFVKAGLRRMQMMLTVFVTTVEAAGAHTCYQHCASASGHPGHVGHLGQHWAGQASTLTACIGHMGQAFCVDRYVYHRQCFSVRCVLVCSLSVSLSAEWSKDNTISFEAFLRGIVMMVSEEYGEL